ncbi:MAG: preprotein translocase subunit SecG [Flavobacteriales bacterium]|jgi:preprotein translocase subunit SecG|nr:MAG: preprotein translocase subunit SecG [Flavobacteriales bacterium]
MIQLFSILIILVSLLLIVIIMVQNPKGGGLSSTFGGGGTQLFGGVKKAGDLLDRSTWGLAIALCALALMMNLNIFKGGVDEDGSVILERGTSSSPQQEFSAPAQDAPVGQESEMIDLIDMTQDSE